MLKNIIFVLPRMLRLCKSLGKTSFLQEQNECTWGWTLAENQKLQILGSQNYLPLTECVAAIFQSVNVTFFTWKRWSITGSDFSHENGRVGKIGEAVFQWEGVSLIFILVWK